MISASRLTLRAAALLAVLCMCLSLGLVLPAGPAGGQPSGEPDPSSYPSPLPPAPESGGPAAEDEAAGSEPIVAQSSADGTVSLVLDEVTAVLGAGDRLVIRGRIVNTGTEPVTDPHMRFALSRRVLDSRDAIAAWKKQPSRFRQIAEAPAGQQPAQQPDQQSDAGKQIQATGLPAEVPAKSEEAFSLQADAAALGLPTNRPLDAWGSYGVAAALTSEQADLTAPAFTTWYPDPQLRPTRLTVLLPVTLPGFDPAGLHAAETLEQAAGPDGALTHALAAAKAADAVSLAVDPRLIAGIENALGIDRPVPDDSPAGNGADAPDSGGPDDGTGGPESADPAATPEAEGGSAPEAAEGSESSAPAAGSETDGTAGGTPAEGDQSEADQSEPDRSEGPETSGAGPDADGADPETSPGPQEQTGLPEPSPRADELPALSAWYEEFLTTAGQRTVIALPYADADLTALAAADAPGLLEAAQAESAALTAALPRAHTDVMWPVAGTLSTSFAREAHASGTKRIIVSDRQQPGLRSYASSAGSTLALGKDAGTIDSVAADSGLAAAAALAGSETYGQLGRTELLAETAAVTTERPFDPRSLLLTLPRQAADASWKDTVTAAAQAPWLSLVSLDDLTDAEPVQRAALTPPSDDPGRRLDGLRTLGRAQGTVDSVAPAFRQPAEVRRELTRALLTCTSAAWAGTAADAGFSACVQAAGAEVESLTGGVRPDEGSAVLLVTGERTTIPVRIDNSTDETAHVMARLVPATPQLRTQLSEPVLVGPGEQARVEVPVEGLANGDVETRVELVAAAADEEEAMATPDAEATTASGPADVSDHYVLPSTAHLIVRVRTDWENIGAAVIGAGLVVVLLIGLYSSVSRGRRKIPKSQLDAALARANETDPG